jgi:hypothetical protein
LGGLVVLDRVTVGCSQNVLGHDKKKRGGLKKCKEVFKKKQKEKEKVVKKRIKNIYKKKNVGEMGGTNDDKSL